MGRIGRILAILTLAAATLVAIPSVVLGCGGGPFSFDQVVSTAELFVIADVQQPVGPRDVFAVERVLKGPHTGLVAVRRDQYPWKLAPGDRVVLAMMHPSFADGAGVTIWVVGRDGQLSDPGVYPGPKTLSGLLATFRPPNSSVADMPASGGSAPVLPMLLAIGPVAGALTWRRMGQARRGP